MGLLRYVSHPEVRVDPDVPVPQWSLSERGNERAAAGAAMAWAHDIDRIVSSAEVKALETAEILAATGALTVEVRKQTAELDRSSTGYVSHDRHEALADELFASPELSAAGWERAIDASNRIVAALHDLLGPENDSHTVVVGHGGVGTLLMCHLGGFDIARSRDQPHGGCHWAWDTTAQRLLHTWQPIDG